MTIFIRLHTLNDKEIRINVAAIESYGTIDSHSYDFAEGVWGKTFVIPIGMPEDERPYIVKETPEEIDYLMFEIMQMETTH